MGLSSSAVRLLSLTERKNTIGCELSILSNQKLSFANDMQKVSRKYNNALNTKVYKLSNNGGIDYVDLSYKNMMRPNENNKNKPYLITDINERVVVDDSYLEYAKMLSPDGSPSSWDGNTRLKILSELTGIDSNSIANYDNYAKAILNAKEDLATLGVAPKNPAEKLSTLEEFIGKLGSNSFGAKFEGGSDWSSIYSGGTIKVSNASGLQTVIDGIKNGLKDYFSDEDMNHFIEACNATKSSVETSFKDENTNSQIVKYEDGNYIVNVKAFIDLLFGAYLNQGGSTKENKVVWVEKGAAYNDWLQQKAEYDAKYNKAQENYNNAVSAKSALFTAEQENMLNFYDEVFSAIAEKGWTYNSNVNDEDYLNQALQSNLYTVTTVTREASEDENGDITYTNSYNTTVASNVDTIVSVNDNEVREKALSEYEYEKSIITAKETKVDLRMQDLETEQSAIKTMIESIEKQKEDNIQSTMKTFA